MSDGQEVYERVYRRFQHIMEVGGEREREGDEGTEDFTGKKAAML